MMAASLTGFFHSLVDCLSTQPASTTRNSEEATGAWQRACRVQSNLDSRTAFVQLFVGHSSSFVDPQAPLRFERC